MLHSYRSHRGTARRDSRNAGSWFRSAVEADSFDSYFEKSKAAKMETSGSGRRWTGIARTHWINYVALGVLVIALVISETVPPFQRRIYHESSPGVPSDMELWRYSMPLKEDTVPPWAVPMISLLFPAVFFVAYYVTFRPPRMELHATLVGLASAVLTTAVLTNFIKIAVGRPRPDFIARCWPSGLPKWNGAFPKCSDTAINVNEGRKSFPSGHSSWSASGLGYLSIWLAGKLRCFDGQGHVWALLVSAGPACIALWIGITRLEDYWHHWEDVCAGWLLGAVVAAAFYRQHYPSLCSHKSGEALVLSHPHQAGGQQSGLPSGRDMQAGDASSELQPLGSSANIRDSSNEWTEPAQHELLPNSSQGINQAGYSVYTLPV